MPGITRRVFLALPVAWALAPHLLAQAEVEERRVGYLAEVKLLYGLFNFESTGTIDEAVDRTAGRYEVHIVGQGSAMTSRVESTGILREGRWAPSSSRSLFVVYGRESRLEVAYDYDQRRIAYHGRAETFLLRRLRLTDDVVPIPAAMNVDDVISATLNYADGRWVPEDDGSFLTHVVRRRRGAREEPDEVEPAYRAELVPFALRVTTDPATRHATAAFDLTRFSSWAREDEPARIVFGPERRPELITARLILGTSLTIRIGR